MQTNGPSGGSCSEYGINIERKTELEIRKSLPKSSLLSVYSRIESCKVTNQSLFSVDITSHFFLKLSSSFALATTNVIKAPAVATNRPP